jgi:hypothetical protein
MSPHNDALLDRRLDLAWSMRQAADLLEDRQPTS